MRKQAEKCDSGSDVGSESDTFGPSGTRSVGNRPKKSDKMINESLTLSQMQEAENMKTDKDMQLKKVMSHIYPLSIEERFRKDM